MVMNSILNIHNLQCGYENRILIRDFNAEIHPGELVALIGENGSGKSTLLRSIIGQEKPIQGKIEIAGASINRLNPKQRALLVSSIPSKSNTVASLDVLTAVTLGRYALSDSRFFFSEKDEVNALECLTQLKCEHLTSKRLDEISDGEFQKVMMARALAQSARLMILDEPTAFLDFKAKNSVMNTLKELCETSQISVLFSSHDLDLVARYADKIWYLHEEKIRIETPDFAKKLSSENDSSL
jgi:iron complex transport system ATP-binding protein